MENKKVQIDGKWYAIVHDNYFMCFKCCCELPNHLCNTSFKKILSEKLGNCGTFGYYIETEPDYENNKIPFSLKNINDYLKTASLLGFIYPDSPEISTDIIKTKVIDGKLQRILPEWVVFAK